jgi:DNA ligase (NAD+)
VALACKFDPPQAATVIRNITVQVGRTGVLTPVAEMDPVEVGGVTVSRATLHNQDEVDRKDIRIGDTVLVRRAGDVIPEVVRADPSKRTGAERPFVMPAACPSCGSPVVRLEGETAYRCLGMNCRAQLAETIRHFVSRGGMDMEGIGEKLILRLIESGRIGIRRTSSSSRRRTWRAWSGWRTSRRKTSSGDRGAKTPPYEKFLFALGIRHVGEFIAKILAARYPSSRTSWRPARRNCGNPRHREGDRLQCGEFLPAADEPGGIDKLSRAGSGPGSPPEGRRELRGKSFVFTGR